METKYFMAFGNQKYYRSLERIKYETESSNVFDQIVIYKDTDLPDYPDFWEKHSQFILSNSRGYGYWIWKPYLVLKTLEKMEENDILVYADAGCTFNHDGIPRLHEYFDMVRNSDYGILSFNLSHLQKTFTKMDLFDFLEMNDETYKQFTILMATIFIIKKCPHSVELVKKWYDVMSNHYHLIDDSPSILPNDVDYVEHRHDQSVFSLLLYKYGSIIIDDETWFPNFDDNRVRSIPILSTRKI